MSNDISEIAVGDLVIMQNATYYEEWNEMPALVIGGLIQRRSLHLHTMERHTRWAYRVQILHSNGLRVNAGRHQLRRLRESEPGKVEEWLEEV